MIMGRLIGPRAWATATVTAVALCRAAPGRSETPNDQQALAGLSDVKVAFDLRSGDPKHLLTQLTVIDETRQSVMSQGAKPDFVLAFRGPATKLVQTDPSQVKAEDRELMSKIAEKVRQLRGSSGVIRIPGEGLGVDSCAVAKRVGWCAMSRGGRLWRGLLVI